MSKTISCQALYDRREQAREISGDDLHEIFRLVADGEPSPSGRRRISAAALAHAAAALREQHAAHIASGGVGGEYLIDMAKFCEAF